jgi:very-short-patch-repair endonuclease
LNDIKREQALKEIGLTVLRFDDGDVVNHIDDVAYRIREYIGDFRKNNGEIHPL